MPYPFRDKTLQFETLRAIGYSVHGGADPNEVFQLCNRIREGNLEDWFVEWRDSGLRALQLAQESERLGNKESARTAYLRASNYLRTAEFFRRDEPDKDELGREISEQAKNAFYRAIENTPGMQLNRFNVPFEDFELPAYLITAAQKEPRATVVVNGGFDGTKEEAYLAFGAAALARGYNFVCFEGPGQGEVIRNQKKPFRPDWHVVITALTDVLIAREEIDQERLVLVGWSMGGYLAAEAITHEHRYAAAILNDGVFDFAAGWRKRAPWWIWWLLKNRYNGLVSTLVALSANREIGSRWGYQNGLWTFQAPDGAALIETILKYTLMDESVKQITTPILVMDPEDDHLLGGQPQELIRHLEPHQEFEHVVFEKRWGASEHCQMGAMLEQDRIMYNWLEKVLPKRY